MMRRRCLRARWRRSRWIKLDASYSAIVHFYTITILRWDRWSMPRIEFIVKSRKAMRSRSSSCIAIRPLWYLGEGPRKKKAR
jgi:hypothetical protein